MSVPCPACDIEKMGAKPLMAFALGVSLGEGFQDMHKVTELMCEQHRPTYVLAMAHAAVAINTRDDEDEPFADDADERRTPHATEKDR